MHKEISKDGKQTNRANHYDYITKKIKQYRFLKLQESNLLGVSFITFQPIPQDRFSKHPPPTKY
jgi:hypothetical protein